jgi:hypothetical protein
MPVYAIKLPASTAAKTILQQKNMAVFYPKNK